jgi:hypothetical protein
MSFITPSFDWKYFASSEFERIMNSAGNADMYASGAMKQKPSASSVAIRIRTKTSDSALGCSPSRPITQPVKPMAHWSM